MKKKVIIIILVVLIVLAGGGFAVWHFFLSGNTTADSEDKAYVTSISDIMNGGSLGITSQLSGVVEPQQEVKIEKDDSKKVSKVYVEEGDEVKVGDKLFDYDVDAINLSLEQAQLELETLTTKITTLESQKESLEKEKESASSDQQLEYSIQIQETELDIKENEYNKTEKEKEITSIEESLKNTTVCSEIDGIVKSVAKTTSSDEYTSSDDSTFISILSLGNYRVKGTVTELNRNSISEGMSVIVRSRVNSEDMWKATIISIANQQDSSNSTDSYYYSGSTGDSASKYTFYAELENMDGLILGQHVYVEPDNGQDEKKTGIWLPYYYIVTEGDSSYVWAAEDGGKLMKTKVTLGEYDEESMIYEIKSGLNENQFIAFPMDAYVDGMSTTTDYSLSLSAKTAVDEQTVTGDLSGDESVDASIDDSVDYSDTLNDSIDYIPDDEDYAVDTTEEFTDYSDTLDDNSIDYSENFTDYSTDTKGDEVYG